MTALEVPVELKPHEASDDLRIPQSQKFTNMFELADADYSEKEAAIFAMIAPPPAGDDYIGWRNWEHGPAGGIDHSVLAKRYRPEVKINRKEVSITYDGDNTYGILVHNPEAYPGERERPRPAVLWFHGGGWSHGLPSMDAGRADFIASELRAVVFNVDYRLVPEYQWPKNHNDCYHSIGWVIEHAKEYNVDPSRLALWGSSAGSHLAAGIALRDAVEHNPSRIRHANLVVPVTCDPRKRPYPLSVQVEHGNVPEELRAQTMTVLRDLLGSDEPSDDRYASPLISETPAHHCSVYISVGGLDWLRDEGIAYALHLRKQGIDAQLEVVPGVPHAFTTANNAYAAQQFWRDQAKVFNMALNFTWD